MLWYFLDSATGGNGLFALFVLAGLAVVAVWLVRRLSGPKTATASELAQRLAAVGLMSGAQFKRFTADVFAAMGHNVTLPGGSGDQGVDLIVDYQGQRVAVQCKNYKKRVGNKPVQKVWWYRCDNDLNVSASPRLSNVTATASESNAAFGVANSGGSSPTMTEVIAKADGGSFARGMENSTSSPKMINDRVTASGGSTENTGMYNYLHPSPTIRESVVSSSGTASHGVWSHFPDDTTSLVTIENSDVKGATGTVKAEGGYKVNVGTSKLDGEAVSAIGTGSAVKCAGVHDENYVFSAGPTCP